MKRNLVFLLVVVMIFSCLGPVSAGERKTVVTTVGSRPEVTTVTVYDSVKKVTTITTTEQWVADTTIIQGVVDSRRLFGLGGETIPVAELTHYRLAEGEAEKAAADARLRDAFSRALDKDPNLLRAFAEGGIPVPGNPNDIRSRQTWGWGYQQGGYGPDGLYHDPGSDPGRQYGEYVRRMKTGQ
jgi:hypothetical protein